MYLTEDADFVETVNPAAILALIEMYEEAKADAARLDWILRRVFYNQVTEDTWAAHVHWHSTVGDMCDRDAIDAAMKGDGP